MVVKLKEPDMAQVGEMAGGDPFIYEGKAYVPVFISSDIAPNIPDDKVVCFDFENNYIVLFDDDTEVQAIKLAIREV